VYAFPAAPTPLYWFSALWGRAPRVRLLGCVDTLFDSASLVWLSLWLSRSYLVMQVKEPQETESRGSSSARVRSLSLISGIEAGTASAWPGLVTHTWTDIHEENTQHRGRRSVCLTRCTLESHTLLSFLFLVGRSEATRGSVPGYRTVKHGDRRSQTFCPLIS